MNTITKSFRMATSMLDEIKEKQEQLGFTTETQTIMHLIRVGLDKVDGPAYIKHKQPRKTYEEKQKEKEEFERKQAEEERQRHIDMVERMGGTITDSHGNKDPNGRYATYTIYHVSNVQVDGKPMKSITKYEETNPLWEIEQHGTEHKQYENSTKEEVQALLASGNYHRGIK